MIAAGASDLIEDTIRILIGWMGVDLIRWLWRTAGDDARAAPLTEYVIRCTWCNGSCVLLRATKPPKGELPDGWVATDSGDIWWCSLKCWVEHWRADNRIEAPPVASAAGGWGGDDYWPNDDGD